MFLSFGIAIFLFLYQEYVEHDCGNPLHYTLMAADGKTDQIAWKMKFDSQIFDGIVEVRPNLWRLL